MYSAEDLLNVIRGEIASLALAPSNPEVAETFEEFVGISLNKVRATIETLPIREAIEEAAKMLLVNLSEEARAQILDYCDAKVKEHVLSFTKSMEGRKRVTAQSMEFALRNHYASELLARLETVELHVR